MQLIGIILLIVSAVIAITWYLKDGVLFLFNYSRLGFVIWSLGLGLYDLSISGMYNPSLMINIMSLIVIMNFGIISYILPSDIDKIFSCINNIEKPNRRYSSLVFGTLCLGFLSFFVNLNAGNLRFFLKNTAAKTSISLSYFLNLMVIVSVFFYFLARESAKRMVKVLYFALSGVSLFLIFCNMSRGPLMFWATAVLTFEICRYVKKRKNKFLSIRQWVLLLLFGTLLVWGFGAMGDFRTVSIFKGGVTAHYKMPSNCPSGIAWIYVYLTSPLENMRYILENETVNHYSWFNLLLYPIIKVFANMIGMGDQYATYVEGFNEVYPYLKPKYGLNVSSFMADAYSDLGIAGIIVYIICFDVIAYWVHRIVISKKMQDISKAIIFPIIIQVAIWSVFSNSVFKIAAIWVDVIFVIIWDKFARCKIKIK